MAGLKKISVIITLTATLLALSNCREITTTTRILSDGSCERTVEVSSDPESSVFPIPGDSTWTITRTTEGKDSVDVYAATKKFPAVSALQEEYPMQSNSGVNVPVTIELRSGFGLFFRYLRYEEIYGRYNPLSHIPIAEYLSEIEIQQYTAGDDSTEIEERVDEWRAHNLYAEMENALIVGAKQKQLTEINTETLAQYRDTLLITVIEEADSTDDLLEIFSEYLGTDQVWELADTVDQVYKRIETVIERLTDLALDDFTNRVVMPGLLMDTNAKSLEGNMALWQFEGGVFEFRDKVMWAESRLLNWWGIGIVLGALVLLGVLLFIAVRRKRTG
ncbi:MAG: hypothetical protein K9N46_06385 [Candidatus Marinimicrobia bacterium]|nr:hypothetical protein [Candidatus Neomarinimicrobiota bacterium]MCF7828607.1 hypothetical protein [Candidatus Neomarinimicrobiota bacterium]MCF7880348.1 hypothetical protein [Candidatus Neomarinimicrobiota bacterium]